MTMFGKICARAIGRCNSTALLTASWMSGASGTRGDKGQGLGDCVVVVAFSVGDPANRVGSRSMRFGDGYFGGEPVATSAC